MYTFFQSNFLEKRARFSIAWMLAFIPMVIAAMYVCRIIVNIPIFDEWGFLSMIEKWQSGHGQWRDILAFHAEFNYLLPLQRIAALISLKYFHWDIRFEILSGFVMLLGTSMLFILYGKRIDALSKPSFVILYLLPIMLLLFSLRQWENLIGPWGVNFFGTTFFVMGTALLLTSSQNFIYLVGAIICASIASLSFLNGLAIWPIGLAGLLIQHRRIHACCWMVFALLFFIIFFGVLYAFPPHANTGIHFWHIIQRFLAVLGAPLSINHQIITGDGSSVIYKADTVIAEIIGLSLLLIVIYLFWKIRKNLGDFTFPIIGILFSIASCLMLAWARGYHDLNQAFTSHYTTLSILLLVCLVVIIIQLRLRGIKIVYLESGLLTMILLSSLYSTLTEYSLIHARHDYLENWAAQIRDYKQTGNGKNPLSKEMVDNASKLDSLKLSVFHTTP